MKGGPAIGRARSLIIELASRTAIVDGDRVELPPTEFSLLAVLARRSGEVVTHKELLEAAFGDSAYMDATDLHWRIWNIRKLIGDRDKRIVRNRRGVGFILDAARVEVVQTLSELPRESARSLLEREATSDKEVVPGPAARARPATFEHLGALPGEPAVVAEMPVGSSLETDGLTYPVRRESPRIKLSRISVLLLAAAATAAVATSWLVGYTLAQRADPGAPSARPHPTPSATSKSDDKDADPTKKKGRADNNDRRRQAGKGRRDAPGSGSDDSDALAMGSGSSSGSGSSTGGTGGTTSPPSAGKSPPAPRQVSAGDNGDRQAGQRTGDGPTERGEEKADPPPPPPPPQPAAPLYHLSHGDTGDHVMTTSSSVANQKQGAGYASAVEGKVFTSQEEGTTAISLDGGSAYIYRSADAAPGGLSITALYRLSSSKDFFYTTSTSAASQAQAQGWSRSTAGYVAA